MMTDDLTYEYFQDSNRLKKVTDATNSPTGFDNGDSGLMQDYTYDENGNMISDLNKGITKITYNHLNLPIEVIWDTTKKIEYLYSATGEKLP